MPTIRKPRTRLSCPTWRRCASVRASTSSKAPSRTYGADAQQVCKVLNDALATEIVCVLRYRRHYYMASGIHSESVKAEFLEHANEEQEHADQIAERIVQLGGEPDLNPAGLLSRSHSEYVEGKTLRDMMREDLVAERICDRQLSRDRGVAGRQGLDDPSA